MHPLFAGILIGIGAAVPIGPVNLEIIRRNLQLGSASGIAMGIGACLADATYLVALFSGFLTLFSGNFYFLKINGLLGSAILAWFAYQAWHSNPSPFNEKRTVSRSLWRHIIEGFVMTFINPYTILFWATISTQLSLLTTSQTHAYTLPSACAGVLFSTLTWVFLLNGVTALSRRRLSQNMQFILNRSGSIILFIFASLGIVNIFWS